ncbi:MAG: AAA family ATPase, partial [Candidatus Competibacteraceae bacterium]|nr:AAA family ATPase [Candidatus Competibacteraceae bacterium]
MIRKIAIRNYRLFRSFDLDFAEGINTLVGANDTGKSTLIEAINLALTGRLNGRSLAQGLSPYLLNMEATREYTEKLKANSKPAPTPPSMIIEVYLEESDQTAILRGSNNLYGEDAFGIRIQAKLSPDYHDEYQSFIADPSGIQLVPTEYYKIDWLGFHGSGITARSVPASASVIDPANIHLQSGVDHHMQQILRTNLDDKERAELSRQYRSLREEFNEKETVREINERLKSTNDAITDRKLSLAIDISQRYTWESSLAAHLDNLPFPLIGKGEQNALKTLLALGRRADDAHMVLIEEPENHLSFTSLRKLITRIEKHCAGKQVIIATHSNFVLNKLGLQNLILLGPGTTTRITDLPKDTVDYFKKLAGFDTLRLVLAKGAILVEGPSDELIVQRAYKDAKGKLPIDNDIDVISVGLAHKRFLDLAIRLQRRVWIVTDNDRKTIDEVQ